MAKLFGQIEEEELDDLPDNLKNTIKAASAAQEQQLATINQQIEAINQKINPTETPEQKAERERAEAARQNGNIPASEVMLYDSRKDIILMKLERDPDKHTAIAVRKFKSEIEANLAKSAPQLRADEAYIRNLVKLSIGTHFGEILAEANKQDGTYNEFFTESGSSGNGNHAAEIVDPVKALSADEKKAADAIGMSYTDYAASLANVREGKF